VELQLLSRLKPKKSCPWLRSAEKARATHTRSRAAPRHETAHTARIANRGRHRVGFSIPTSRRLRRSGSRHPLTDWRIRRRSRRMDSPNRFGGRLTRRDLPVEDLFTLPSRHLLVVPGAATVVMDDNKVANALKESRWAGRAGPSKESDQSRRRCPRGHCWSPSTRNRCRAESGRIERRVGGGWQQPRQR
jgi:hypothetical protein